jgi:hypothetical protein
MRLHYTVKLGCNTQSNEAALHSLMRLHYSQMRLHYTVKLACNKHSNEATLHSQMRLHYTVK